MTNNLNQHFLLFSVCVPVKGSMRSIICDLQNNDYYYIPNDLYDILTIHRLKSVQEIINVYGVENSSVIEEYFEFLLEKRLVTLLKGEELDLFPPLPTIWENPKQITNAVIEVSASVELFMRQIIIELNSLGCESLELRFYDEYELENIENILSFIEKSSISSIVILVKHLQTLGTQDYQNILNKYSKMHQIIVHSYHGPSTKVMGNDSFSNVIFQHKKLSDCSFCGVTNINYFKVNHDLLLESLHNNSCLNRKVSIDTNGNIKNCPSLKESYGNFRDVSISDTLVKGDIKKLWHIDKSMISVCRDCEHRLICTDCRAYLSDSNDIFSKPLKCGYDPYTATWKK